MESSAVKIVDGHRTVGGTDPEPDDLINCARRMVPDLIERAADGESERRLSPETIDALREAGLFRVLQPKRWGGYEMDPGTFCEIEMALAEGDMSTGWVYGVMGHMSWLLGLGDDRAAHEVWSKDSSVLICSSLIPMGRAVPVKNGFQLTGNWKYSSGCEYAEWAFIAAVVATEPCAPPDVRLFLVPREQYRIADAWYVTGLKATGSQDLIVEDVFVPSYRTQKLDDCFRCVGAGQAVNTSHLYRIPFGQIVFPGVSCAAIGALQGMLNAVGDFVKTRNHLFDTSIKAADDHMVQLTYAEVAAGIDEMKAVLHRNNRKVVEVARRNEIPSIEERERQKFQSGLIAERCSLLAARLFKLTGGAGLLAHRRFGRIVADINAARQHIANQYEYTGRNWGATLLGVQHAQDPIL